MKPHKNVTEKPYRCCWICGEAGGMGASFVLKTLGYEIELGGPNQQIGYAHTDCASRLQRKQMKRR